MKIAILTLPLHTNYGGILQAYALQTILKRLGNDVEMIQKKQSIISTLQTFLIHIKRNLLQILHEIYSEEVPLKKDYQKAVQYTERFINGNIKRRFIQSIREIQSSDYDCIVVGSDQIWRRSYYDAKYKDIMFSTDPKDGFLRFTKNWDIRRIAYATSFGVDDWDFSQKETQAIASLLKSFNGVSIREKSGVDNCKKFLNHNAEHVLDPTFLLEKEDYLKLVENSDSKNKSFGKDKLFCYILDFNDSKRRIIERIATKMNLSPLFMTGDLIKDQVQPPVEEWILAFKESNFIVTDSFHACVFSIIFNKPFIAIGNKTRGMSRFNSLLSVFKLNNRLIEETCEEYPSLNIDNWDRINETLKIWKEKSNDFLRKSLNT